MNLLEALAHVLRTTPDQLPPPAPYNTAREEQISHVAETYDPETGRSQPLLERRGR